MTNLNICWPASHRIVVRILGNSILANVPEDSRREGAQRPVAEGDAASEPSGMPIPMGC